MILSQPRSPFSFAGSTCVGRAGNLMARHP
jgi:hypothetical protein